MSERRVRRLVGGVAGLPDLLTRLEDAVSHLYSFGTLLRSQAALIRQHHDVTDVDNPLEDVMKCHQGVWLPLEESRFPLWMREGEYQRDLYDAALGFVEKREVAVDAGANVGFFSRPMAEDFDVVHAFEPVWLCRACLARNVRSGNCIIYPFGLSDGPDEVEIQYTPVASGAGQITGSLAESVPFPMQTQPARLVALDSLELPGVDFLKIDVQGHEEKVLRGARDTLQRSRAVVLCEYVLEGHENREVEGLLSAQGYTLAERIGKDGIFVKSG